MLDKPVDSSVEDIEDDRPRRRRRQLEDRISDLEDKNESLSQSNKTLEKSLKDICKSLEMKPPSNPQSGKKSFWDELTETLGL